MGVEVEVGAVGRERKQRRLLKQPGTRAGSWNGMDNF